MPAVSNRLIAPLCPHRTLDKRTVSGQRRAAVRSLDSRPHFGHYALAYGPVPTRASGELPVRRP